VRSVTAPDVNTADVTVILLDAGGVLLFPQPDVMLPPLRAAGVTPDLTTLERAHYRAMSTQDLPSAPEPQRATWWRDYLFGYIAECGVPDGKRELLAAEMAAAIYGFTWTRVGAGVPAAMRDLAGLGVRLGVVSNSDGSVQGELRRLGVCYVPDGQPRPAEGIEVGVVIDSAAVGVAKPDPEIFRFALDALGVPASTAVLHVGDSLRYDVTGALAAGLRPVHLDPYGFCPAPAGHEHITSLAGVLQLPGVRSSAG
jgi:putative hydrolase of the HAD superfamily